MLENFLGLASGYANQWGDDLDTFNPYNSSPSPFRSDNSDADLRASGSCRGFFKKVCIALVTAAMGAAVGSITYGGGVLVGAAAGYIIARCCICCSCNIVCNLDR
jgi:hypothetical protein